MEKLKITGLTLKGPKNIVITSGPTDERLDAVMKITNMSTGKLGATIANTFLEQEEKDINKLYYLSTKKTIKPNYSKKLECIRIETAADLLKELKRLLTMEKIDTVIHAAAVGDYKGKYAITGKMLAKEIASSCYNQKLTLEELKQRIEDIIRSPKEVVDDKNKISSNEKDLIFKVDLTEKVIGHIKEVSKDTQLIGFKLLDDVSFEKLIEKARELRENTKADYIIANDLSNIGNGKHLAYFVGETGIDYTCTDKQEIAKTLRKVIFKR